MLSRKICEKCEHYRVRYSVTFWVCECPPSSKRSLLTCYKTSLPPAHCPFALEHVVETQNDVE